MRQIKRPIDYLFPRTRQAVLTALLTDPKRSWYRSDLAKHLKLQPSSLQRELDGLVRAGVLTRRTEGNRSYFQADPACPFLPDLRGLVEKTVGLVAQLRRVLEPLGAKVKVAFVFGSIARGSERSESDVDLMVIGTVGVKDLVSELRAVEERLGRPVNVHTYTPAEFAEKARSGHHFLRAVLDREKTFVVGTVNDLDEVLEPRPR